MKDKIRKYKMYAAWEYEREEQDLNRYSKEGLQLVKGGSFSSLFRVDTSKCYIYQLDYNNNIEDMSRYIEVFAEQGWEYINSTANGWHYFRKLYEVGMNEDETRIYTDVFSLHEMENRWMRLLTIFAVFFDVAFLFYLIHAITEKNMIVFADSVLYAIMSITFFGAVINFKRKRVGKKTFFIIPYKIVLSILLVFLFAIIIMSIVQL